MALVRAGPPTRFQRAPGRAASHAQTSRKIAQQPAPVCSDAVPGSREVWRGRKATPGRWQERFLPGLRPGCRSRAACAWRVVPPSPERRARCLGGGDLPGPAWTWDSHRGDCVIAPRLAHAGCGRRERGHLRSGRARFAPHRHSGADTWFGSGPQPIRDAVDWSGRQDLNLRLLRPERSALPG